MIDYYDKLITLIGTFGAILAAYFIQDKILGRQTKYRLAQMILVELGKKPQYTIDMWSLMKKEVYIEEELKNMGKDIYTGLVNSGNISHFGGDTQINLHDFYRAKFRSDKLLYMKKLYELIEEMKKIKQSNRSPRTLVRLNLKKIVTLLLIAFVVLALIINKDIFLIIASHLSKFNIIDIVDWIIKLGMA